MESTNGKVRFIEVGGKFIWKIYDDNGSVMAKSDVMFDNNELCQANFNEFLANADAGDGESTEVESENELTDETPESEHDGELTTAEVDDNDADVGRAEVKKSKKK